MKLYSTISVLIAVFLFGSFVYSCKNDDNNKTGLADTPDCAVQLFDGNNYTDDTILIQGPGEFPNLETLPGSGKNWNDEADSFKAGKNASVTMWSKTNFQGDSITYEKGAHKPTINEPSSMKIRCN